MKVDRYIPFILPIVFFVVGSIYYFVDPSYNIWVPKCPWKLLTHTNCPSCGIQRVLYHSLHGQFLLAFKTNPFLCISIPYAFLAILCKWYNWHHCFDKLYRVVFGRVCLLTYTCLFFLWWVIRICFNI